MRPKDLSPQEVYIESLYAGEDEVLADIRGRLTTLGRWGVNIGPAEGRLLQLFLRLVAARRVLEIGTLFGYSTVWMARALPEDGLLITIERDPVCAEQARLSFAKAGLAEQIELLEGEAEANLAVAEDRGPFDVVFIDANKSAYCEYLDWAEKHVRKGGLIIADNTLLGGGVACNEKPPSLSKRQYAEMRKFNERLVDPGKFLSMLLPTREGLSVALKL